MSYIVPRNKPDRCTNCPFMDRITYDCMLMYGNDYSDFESQYEHCPLIELPQHGRLIAEKTITEIRYHDADGYHIVNGWQLCELEIDAPTVIEAEE